ncbi:amino acid-binding ACT domain protein [Thioalkalivibrio sp. K90mix]|uniref:glycine cleavage system protein R n=1 Tax=Thioalkalivibrio sp. (strain K90mix) TaxID=396595 RepID=UPI0001959F8E|nr:ACT domain-containing protein [Thioalkalivibrio sp. K90mix]ADC72719.1 amino acid-binding ACT domain protein [Thioalkalivibrio sp. K90mix]
MKTSVILTLIGPDRPGLVSAVAARARAAGGNWLESRMTQLAGQFAGVVLLEVEAEAVDGLEAALRDLEGDGLQVHIQRGSELPPTARRAVELDLIGHDRPGIVQDITAVLSRHGVSVETLETACEPGSMTGEPMFRAKARLGVPEGLGLDTLQDDLEALANELMVDLELHDPLEEPPEAVA